MNVAKDPCTVAVAIDLGFRCLWDFGGEGGVTSHNGTYTYDDPGRLTTITQPGLPTENYTWYADGTLATLPGNGGTQVVSIDASGQVSSLTDGTGSIVATTVFDAFGVRRSGTESLSEGVTRDVYGGGNEDGLEALVQSRQIKLLAIKPIVIVAAHCANACAWFLYSITEACQSCAKSCGRYKNDEYVHCMASCTSKYIQSKPVDGIAGIGCVLCICTAIKGTACAVIARAIKKKLDLDAKPL